MTIINLVFRDKPNNKQPINLVFGATGDTEEIPNREINAVISFYEFELFGKIDVLNPISLNATIPLYNFSVFGGLSIDYGINENLVYNAFNSKYNAADAIFRAYVLSFNSSSILEKVSRPKFGSASIVKWLYSIKWGGYSKLAKNTHNNWGMATQFTSPIYLVKWGKTIGESLKSTANWSNAEFRYNNYSNLWGLSGHVEKISQTSFKTADNFTSKNYLINWGLGSSFDLAKRIVWNIAMMPGGCGTSIRPPYKPPIVPPNDNITIVKNLIFCHKPNNKNPINLIFGDDCKRDDHSIEDKNTYTMKNTIKIFRTDNDHLIQALSVDIGANRQDYLWSGNLSLPYSELESISDKPEIEININQYKFVVDINEINIKKAFNYKMIELSVFSTTQRLNTIKAHKIDIDMSSNAIMAAQLHRDDLVTGFEFINSDVDWIIPANLIEYDDANALDIISQFGVATEDIVVSHAYEKEIMIKPKYPTGDPVYSLPSDKLFDYSEATSKGNIYNAIVVSGENVGVTAVIRKEGTAGEKIAPMVINKLITEEQAARRVGLNKIYNTSDIAANIDVVSPLYPEAPLLYPSDLVRIDDQLGWIDTVGISASNDCGAITIKHSFSLEKKVV